MAGRKPKFNEPSQGVSIKVPKSKVEDFKKKAYKIVDEYLKDQSKKK